MSGVRLVIREAEQDWSGTIHGSWAERAIAALSADPTTLGELETATARFAKSFPDCSFFANLLPGLHDEPYDAGLVVIDLVARLVVVDSTYSSPGPDGRVRYHDGHQCTDIGLWYHVADDWLFTNEQDDWRAVADARRRERSGRPPLDTRGVLYGRPMVEFVARETCAAFARRDEIAATVRARRAKPIDPPLVPDSNATPDRDEVADRLNDPAIAATSVSADEQDDGLFYDTLKDIHAAWLLTPRNDLNGRSPREIMFEGREHIRWDLQNQCQAWSVLEACPPGLDPDSFAFRYGGFGTHELVEYYELVRMLLWSCWEQLTELHATPPDERKRGEPAIEPFLANEVPRLEHVRDQWLDTPDPEIHARTPRAIIDRERARLPEGVSGREAMVDPDCPCCQMMAESSGPCFWHLDGSEMDDGFAFDLFHRTYEEWEQEQRDWEEHSRKCDAERSERRLLGVPDFLAPGDDPRSVWSASYSVGDAPSVPLGLRLFGFGCHLAELITDLRGLTDRESTPPDVQQLIDQLNRDFGNVRALLQESEQSVTEALFNPLIDRFAETLDDVTASRPDLAPKCEFLADCLATLSDQDPPESIREALDQDLPF
jgi:hypothetical protein